LAETLIALEGERWLLGGVFEPPLAKARVLASWSHVELLALAGVVENIFAMADGEALTDSYEESHV